MSHYLTATINASPGNAHNTSIAGHSQGFHWWSYWYIGVSGSTSEVLGIEVGSTSVAGLSIVFNFVSKIYLVFICKLFIDFIDRLCRQGQHYRQLVVSRQQLGITGKFGSGSQTLLLVRGTTLGGPILNISFDISLERFNLFYNIIEIIT